MVMHLTDKPVPLLERVVYASVAVGISLMVIKFVAYGLTGSAAILSDAAESIVNVVTALFSLYSLKVSFKPPDELRGQVFTLYFRNRTNIFNCI